jgi:hypothetical protein
MKHWVIVLALTATPAVAQQPPQGQPQSGPAAPPSGVLTPAPVPASPPATSGATVAPERIAPPAATAGPPDSTPFSTIPTGAGGSLGGGPPDVAK